MSDKKTCNICRRELPIELFHVRSVSESTGKTYRQWACKTCQSKYVTERLKKRMATADGKVAVRNRLGNKRNYAKSMFRLLDLSGSDY